MRTLIAIVFLIGSIGANAATFSAPVVGTGGTASATNAINSINSDTTLAQNLTTDGSGNDVGVTTGSGTHTINLPTASATKRGVLSSNDWQNFNGKQASNAVLGNLVGTVAKNVTNVTTVFSNATSKPLVQSYSAGTLTLSGLEAGANVTLTWNGSNYVVASTGGGGGTSNFQSLTNSGSSGAVLFSDNVAGGNNGQPTNDVNNLSFDVLTGRLTVGATDNGGVDVFGSVTAANLEGYFGFGSASIGAIAPWNYIRTEVMALNSRSNVTFTVGDNLHINGTNYSYRYTASTNASLVVSNLFLDTPVRLEVMPSPGAAGWALTFNIPAASWPGSNAWAFATNAGKHILEVEKVSSTRTNVTIIEWPAFDVDTGWKVGAVTNYATRKVTFLETNQTTLLASNSTTAQLDFTTTPLYQLNGTLSTNISGRLTNLVQGRSLELWILGPTNGGPVQTFSVVTNGLNSATSIAWNSNVNTNGNSDLNLTNKWAAKVLLKDEGTFDGVHYVSAEAGYYKVRP